jgi:hypothetical protein
VNQGHKWKEVENALCTKTKAMLSGWND